jgi:DNA polymerase-4
MLGVHRVGDLQRVPLETLRTAFAANTAMHLKELGRFEHSGEVSEERKSISESRERTFDRDVTTMRELEEILVRQTGELCEALGRRGTRGRTVAIKVRLDDFSTHTRARTLSSAVNTPEQVAPVALELLRAFAPTRPVRLLGVRLAGLVSAEEETGQLALAV